MKKFLWIRNTIKPISVIAVTGGFLFSSMQAMAELTPEVKNKISSYQEKLASWAKDPEVVNAIKAMNGQTVSMSNSDWKTLSAEDPLVEKYVSSDAGKKLSDWQKDKSLGKLFLRDKNGNFVAGSKKPAIFNISDRPPFKNAIAGKSWHSKKAKKDPTTNLSSIQLSHPVSSDGENIGIIHTAIILE